MTCQQLPGTQVCGNKPIRARLLLAGDSSWRSEKELSTISGGRVARGKTHSERMISPLQLAMFFSRRRCVASCKKKLPRVTWPFASWVLANANSQTEGLLVSFWSYQS